MDGGSYSFSIDHVEYVATRDGRPLTLVDCWHAVYGVGGAAIYAPTGRVVLRNAGSLSARAEHIRRAVRVNRRAAAVVWARRYPWRAA